MTHDDYPPNYYLQDRVHKQPFQDTLEELRGVPGAPILSIKGSRPFWRRLWFVVSCIPRYLISGSAEVP